MRQLYTNSKVLFHDPYVVMLDHEYTDLSVTPESYKSALKSARDLIHGSWGYTKHQVEVNYGTSSTIETIRVRSYWCFEDETDALQFRLTIGTSARRVMMWPSLPFTLYMVHEDNL